MSEPLPVGDIVTRSNVMTEVVFDLNDQEVMEAGEELARIDQEIADIEAEKSSVAKGYNAQIKAKVKEAVVQRDKINHRKEVRPEACRLDFDYGHAEVRTYLEDGGKLVNTRTMKAEELQTPIPGTVEDGGPPEEGEEQTFPHICGHCGHKWMAKRTEPGVAAVCPECWKEGKEVVEEPALFADRKEGEPPEEWEEGEEDGDTDQHSGD